jgi:hypothetical protein
MKYMPYMLVESFLNSDLCNNHLHANRRIEIRPRAVHERAVRIE